MIQKRQLYRRCVIEKRFHSVLVLVSLLTALLMGGAAIADDSEASPSFEKEPGLATISIGLKGWFVLLPGLETQVEFHARRNHSVVTGVHVNSLALLNAAGGHLGYRYTFQRQEKNRAMFLEAGVSASYFYGVGGLTWSSERLYFVGPRAVVGAKFYTKGSLIYEISGGVSLAAMVDAEPGPVLPYGKPPPAFVPGPVPEINFRMGWRTKRQQRSHSR